MKESSDRQSGKSVKLSGVVARRFVLILALILTPIAHAQHSIGFSPSPIQLGDSLFLGQLESDLSLENLSGKGELWGSKWGVSAERLESNDEFLLDGQSSEYRNVDIKRRFGLSNSSIELGLGWQEVNVEQQLDASGVRLSLGGEVGVLGALRVYGSTSYFPQLEDDLSKDDLSGYELEAGLRYQPLPSLSLKAGYRHFSLDNDGMDIDVLGNSSGFLLGTDLSW